MKIITTSHTTTRCRILLGAPRVDEKMPMKSFHYRTHPERHEPLTRAAVLGPNDGTISTASLVVFWQVASTGTRAAPTARATPTTRTSSGYTSARTSSKPGFSAERMLMECRRMCHWPGLMAQRRLWTRRSRTFESSNKCYRPQMSRTNANR